MGYLDGVLLPFFRINGHLDALTQDLELFDGGRTERVAGSQEHLHTALGLQVQGQLGREGGLTRTVETGHQHHAGIPLHIDVLGRGAHKIGQFVVGNLHHHLLRLHGGEHVGAHSLVLHAVAEVLGHLVADVGVQQGLADVLDRFRYVDFGDFPFTLQYLERPLQSLTQVLEHSFFALLNLANIRILREERKSCLLFLHLAVVSGES